MSTMRELVCTICKSFIYHDAAEHEFSTASNKNQAKNMSNQYLHLYKEDQPPDEKTEYMSSCQVL